MGRAEVTTGPHVWGLAVKVPHSPLTLENRLPQESSGPQSLVGRLSSAEGNLFTFSAVGANPSDLKRTFGVAAECPLQ